MSQWSHTGKFTNVIGRISVEKLHLCEPGLNYRVLLLWESKWRRSYPVRCRNLYFPCVLYSYLRQMLIPSTFFSPPPPFFHSIGIRLGYCLLAQQGFLPLESQPKYFVLYTVYSTFVSKQAVRNIQAFRMLLFFFSFPPPNADRDIK